MKSTGEGKSRLENLYCGFDDNLSPSLSDQDVREYMAQYFGIESQENHCSVCSFDCQYRDQILELAEKSKEEFTAN